MFKRIVGTDVAQTGLKPAVDFPAQASAPRCFALAPLYGHLVTRQVGIKSLGDDGTLGDATVSAVFTAIDAEHWVRRFLGDMDRFLAASVPTGTGDPSTAGTALARVLDSKRALVSAIAAQLQGVIDPSADDPGSDPGYPKSLQVARDALVQQLQVSLLKAYDIPVMVQHDTSPPTTGAEAGPATHNTGTHRDAPQVPVPLRFCPAPPSIGEQTAAPTFDTPQGLQQLPAWTYKLTVAHEFAAQDTAGITTEFNLSRRPPRRRGSVAGADLFGCMAQYITVADKLWKLLETAALTSGEKAPKVNACRTFADLAASVADHWSIRLSENESDSETENDRVAGASHTFGLRVAYSQNGAAIESVSFTRERAQADSGNAWPQVDVLLPDGFSVALLPQSADPSSLAVAYMPEKGVAVPAFARQVFQLTWSGLNVSAFQNACARLSVVRNQDILYDPLHPDVATPRTNPVFLLDTAEVAPNSSVAPSIEASQPREITGANLQVALEDAIETLFPSTRLVPNTRATWRLDYSYELARSDGSSGDDPHDRVRLPVTLYPDGPLAGLAQALADAGQRWIDARQPAREGARWILGVVLHSGVESGTQRLFTADLFYRITS